MWSGKVVHRFLGDGFAATASTSRSRLRNWLSSCPSALGARSNGGRVGPRCYRSGLLECAPPHQRCRLFKLRATLLLALLGRPDGAYALFNDSTLRTVPACHGAPAPRGRRATMDAAHTFARHCVIAVLLPAMLARGHAPLFVRWSRRLLLSADRAVHGPGTIRSAGWDEAAYALQRSSSAHRTASHPHGHAGTRPHRCSIALPTF